MEELGPFLFFIFIALVQLVKFLIEKTKGKTAPVQQNEETAPPKRSALEDFFEGIAKKLELQPQPTAMPDWPDDIERPNYTQEMDQSEEELEYLEKPIAEIIPMPEPVPLNGSTLKRIEKTVAFQAPPQVASSVFAGTSNMRLPSVPLMKSNANENININLKNRKTLKQAVIAHIIFSQPRAYDCSFDNTVAK
ncbi:MAG: hypothetical protein V3V05_11340 [Pontiella sp.]